MDMGFVWTPQVADCGILRGRILGTDAPLDHGLQAHTCYDYTGGFLEEQSFDLVLIDQGKFKIPYFDVCMSVGAVETNSAVLLAVALKKREGSASETINVTDLTMQELKRIDGYFNGLFKPWI